jgi:hypothetical protein
VRDDRRRCVRQIRQVVTAVESRHAELGQEMLAPQARKERADAGQHVAADHAQPEEIGDHRCLEPRIRVDPVMLCLCGDVAERIREVTLIADLAKTGRRERYRQLESLAERCAQPLSEPAGRGAVAFDSHVAVIVRQAEAEETRLLPDPQHGVRVGATLRRIAHQNAIVFESLNDVVAEAHARFAQGVPCVKRGDPLRRDPALSSNPNDAGQSADRRADRNHAECLPVPALLTAGHPENGHNRPKCRVTQGRSGRNRRRQRSQPPRVPNTPRTSGRADLAPPAASARGSLRGVLAETRPPSGQVPNKHSEGL